MMSLKTCTEVPGFCKWSTEQAGTWLNSEISFDITADYKGGNSMG